MRRRSRGGKREKKPKSTPSRSQISARELYYNIPQHYYCYAMTVLHLRLQIYGIDLDHYIHYSRINIHRRITITIIHFVTPRVKQAARKLYYFARTHCILQ